jgi:putative transposase
MWNLPPPPGFEGLAPNKPLTVYYRHLPHWRQDGATYFVTFRLADSLPQEKLNELAAIKQAWQRNRRTARGTALPSRRDQAAQESRSTTVSSKTDGISETLAHELQAQIEAWLDQGMGECPLKHAHLASFLTSAMHHFDGDRYELGCYVVMPNHAHAIVRPLNAGSDPLEELLGAWKKYSARRINHELKQRG